MRVIAGIYRGRLLKSPASLDVRPTSDRLRETLFNVLGNRVADSRFLDLCAGSGAVGIEALSRGAAHSTFVDQSRRACRLIETNLSSLRISGEQAAVVCSDSYTFLQQARSRQNGPWDLVFFDPPYQSEYLPILTLLGMDEGELMTGESILIVEHFHKNELPEVVHQLRRTRILKQGESSLSFFRPSPLQPPH
jgi:16S rRNA (guanine(966)-N(2))-methyltransferase RsmD